MKKQIKRVRRTRVSQERISLKKRSDLLIKKENEKLDEDLKQTFPASDPLSYY